MDLRPLPLPSAALMYWWLSFGWHHEVMNHIFDSTEESYTIRHLTDRMRSANVERTFCPLNIRYIFTLPVIHPFLIRQSFSWPFFVRYLSVKYALLMRFMSSSHAPWRPSSPSRRPSSLDEHRIKNVAFFCPFGVRNHYPLICDSTINIQHLHLNKVWNTCTFTVVDLPKCVLFEYIC